MAERWEDVFDRTKGLDPVARGVEWSKWNDSVYSDPAREALAEPGWQDFYKQVAGRGAQAPVAGDPRYAQWQQQSRAQQQTVIQDLMRAAAGDPNSYAQQQLRSSMANARGGVAALGGAQRGQGAGSGLRGISATQAGVNAAQGAQSALLMQQEQMAAYNQLVQALQQGRQQDMGYDSMMAQQSLAGQGEADRMYQQMLGLGINDTVGRTQNQLGYGAAKIGVDTAQREMDRNVYQSLLNAGGTAFSTAQQAFAPKSDRQKIEDAFNGG